MKHSLIGRSPCKTICCVILLVFLSSITIYFFLLPLPIECPECKCPTNPPTSAPQTSNNNYFYLGEGRAMVRLPHTSQPIFINTNDRQMVPHLLTGAGWQKGETEYFKNSVKRGMTVVEIGANFGYYSLMWALELTQDKKSKLILVEADPVTFGLLKQSLEINGFLTNEWGIGENSVVDLRNIAVGLQAGDSYWKCEKTRILNARIAEKQEIEEIPKDLLDTLKKGSNSKIEWKDFIISRLPIFPLADILPLQVDFMKIDIEGYEYEAFQSLLRYFKIGGKISHLVMEVNPFRHKRRQSLAKGSDAAINNATFLEFMHEVEIYFKLAIIDDDKCRPIKKEEIQKEEVLCLRPHTAQRTKNN